MLTLTWGNLSQNFITYDNGLVDGVDTCITCQTLDMTTHVFSNHCDDSSLSTGTCCAA
jgi:hypothetical protein